MKSKQKSTSSSPNQVLHTEEAAYSNHVVWMLSHAFAMEKKGGWVGKSLLSWGSGRLSESGWGRKCAVGKQSWDEPEAEALS